MIRFFMLYAFVMIQLILTVTHAQDKLSQDAVAVLKKHCFSCHAEELVFPGLDLRDHDGLVRKQDNHKRYLVPGKPEESLIFQVIVNKTMPPSEQANKPDIHETEILRKWILEDAPPLKSIRPEKKFIGEITLQKLVRMDLENRDPSERKFLRYFTLAHLWNSNLDEQEFFYHGLAVSKLLNSLSSERRIVPPQKVDADGVLLRFDLRDYGWTNEVQWQTLLKAYPYALSWKTPDAQVIAEQTDCDLSMIRGDWFVFHASRPPLYHQLLTLPGSKSGLPTTSQELEKLLGVNVQENILKAKVIRGGLTGENSGPSDHQRLLERHPSKFGYYWVSYDTAGDTDRQNFFHFPLGPRFLDGDQVGAFHHDGGELIFNLPNGLIGFMLVKSDGKRIDIGPLEIVKDVNQFAGTQVIKNGISCFGCHKQGIIPFQDGIREFYLDKSQTVIGKRVMELYPSQTEIDKFFAKDQDSFSQKLLKTYAPFLPKGQDTMEYMKSLPEPIQKVSRIYSRQLNLPDLARELGLPANPEIAEEYKVHASAAEFKTAIKFNAQLQKLQLAPVIHKQSITRDHWETIYRDTAYELKLGTPLTIH